MGGNHFSIVKQQTEVTVPSAMFANSRENSTHSPCCSSYCRSELVNFHICWDTTIPLWRNNSVYRSLRDPEWKDENLGSFIEMMPAQMHSEGKLIWFFRNTSCSFLTVLRQWATRSRRQTSRWIRKARAGQIHALMYRFDLAFQMFYHSIGSFL